MNRPVEIGTIPGQPRLTAAGPAPTLGTGRDVLPELEDVADVPKSMWRHPAFIVSVILALLALIAAGIFLVLSLLGGSAGAVSGAEIKLLNGNVHLTWSSSGAVDLYAVTNGEASDLSQLITEGTEAWVPAALGLYDQTTCFVVRSTDRAKDPVELSGDVLAKQQAASVCVRDGAEE